MTWSQVYDPLGNVVLSTALAALPILVLTLLKVRVGLAPRWR